MSPRSTTDAVVVTGASTGIGEACALHLTRVGFRVFAGVRRTVDGEALERKAAGPLTPVLLDVTDASSIRSAAATVTAALEGGGLAGLVNNAGIVVVGPLEFVPLDDLRQQLEVNVVGQIAVTQAFLPLLRRGRGRIVNMGSSSGHMPTPFLGPYAASKFALGALNDTLRMELRAWGLHVALVEPGSMATPIWRKARSAADERAKGMPAEAGRLYGAIFDLIGKAAGRSERAGRDPAVVARVVETALTSTRPRARYFVGTDARIGAILSSLIPNRMRDDLIRWRIGLPKSIEGDR